MDNFGRVWTTMSGARVVWLECDDWMLGHMQLLSSGKPLGWSRRPRRGLLPCRGPFSLTHARRIAGRTPAAEATPGGEHAQQQPALPQAPREGEPQEAGGETRRPVLTRRAPSSALAVRLVAARGGMRHVTRYPQARTSPASGPSFRDRFFLAPMPVSSVTGNSKLICAGEMACLSVTRPLRASRVG